MDSYYVIDITDDLASLENDYASWVGLPFNFRKRGDEECIRRYNCTNTDLFNRIKANIIEKMGIDTDKVSIEVPVGEANIIIPDLTDNDSLESDSLEVKKQMSRDLNNNDNIAILTPGDYKDMDELDNAYMKYINLNATAKRLSNSYSRDIWGYDVYNIYAIIRSQLDVIDDEEKVSLFSKGPILYHAENLMLDNDIIGMKLLELDSTNEALSPVEKAEYSVALEKIEESKKDNSGLVIRNFVPYFTADEMANLGVVSTIENYAFDESVINVYPRLVKSLMEDYTKEENKYNPITENRLRNTIIALGWNPEVHITEESIEFARQKQLNWYRNREPEIIDIRHLTNESTSILESTAAMRKEYEDRDLYPIYIVMSFSGTVFGKIIRAAKKCTYSHVGMALDSNLQEIYTFKYNTKDSYNGFHIENLETYLNVSDEAIIDVIAIFVDKATRDRIQIVLKDFIDKRARTRYNFGNLLNILFDRVKSNDPENLKLVCSQFVDTVLKLANIDLTGKSSNLVIPQDFHIVANKPKVFKVFEGLAKEYNERKVEGLFYTLFRKYNRNDIKYDQAMQFTIESMMSLIESNIIDNESANRIVSEIRDLLTPVAVIQEKKFPIEVSGDGDIIVNLTKSLETEYQEAHKLLLLYDDANPKNIEGMKHELARLFFVNSVIEQKTAKMNKNDERYTKLINLRARVLNDFKKYFKVVLDAEPDFDFNDYFKKSEYNNATIVIDKSIIRVTAKAIANFLKLIFGGK
jgi:hypothetical protein